MTEEIKRAPGGRFAKGQSGNKAGARMRKPQPLLTIDDFNRMMLEIAEERAEITVNDERRVVTLLQRNMWSLGVGKGNQRLAAKDFIELVKAATYSHESRERNRPRPPRPSGA